MPATPARIGFILQQYRTAVAESAENKAMFGSLARQSDDPVPTYFDNEADAQVIADARLALLGKPRRRFSPILAGVDDVIDLPLAGGIPVAMYVDEPRDVNAPMLVCSITVDLAKNQSTIQLWG